MFGTTLSEPNHAVTKLVNSMRILFLCALSFLLTDMWCVYRAGFVPSRPTVHVLAGLFQSVLPTKPEHISMKKINHHLMSLGIFFPKKITYSQVLHFFQLNTDFSTIFNPTLLYVYLSVAYAPVI